MPVLDQEAALQHVRQLPRGGQVAVGKYIAVHPRVGGGCRAVEADRVQQAQAVVVEQPADRVEVGRVVFRADMLKHPDGDDFVKAPPQFAVVEQLQRDGQAAAALLRQCQLFA